MVDAGRRPARWIWVYHWPPLGSPTCWTGQRHYGDADLGGWIDGIAPELVLTGHVHEPPFMPAGAWADRSGSTWVFNAGRQIGPVPSHIEIDLAAARHVALDDGRRDSEPGRRAGAGADGLLTALRRASVLGFGLSCRSRLAPGTCRSSISRSTSVTIVRPGASPYWCFRSARYVVTKFEPLGQPDRDEPRDRADRGQQRLAVGGMPQHARACRLDACAVRTPPSSTDYLSRSARRGG